MTRDGFFLPCSPHLVCEKCSTSFALTKFENSSPLNHFFLLPNCFRWGWFWHCSAMLPDKVGRRLRSPNGPTEAFSLFEMKILSSHTLSISSLWSVEPYNQCLHCLFLNTHHPSGTILCDSCIAYPDVLVSLQFKNNPVLYTIRIWLILATKLMIFSFLKLVN